MAAIDGIRESASGAVRLSRGLADRAIRFTGPPLARTVGRIVARVPTRRTPPAPAGGTTIFAPTKKRLAKAIPDDVPADSPPERTTQDTQAVTPSTVARNIGPPRPVAKPAARKPVRKSVPGAKLPPPRPRTT